MAQDYDKLILDYASGHLVMNCAVRDGLLALIPMDRRYAYAHDSMELNMFKKTPLWIKEVMQSEKSVNQNKQG